jgi:hypothetical protein
MPFNYSFNLQPTDPPSQEDPPVAVCQECEKNAEYVDKLRSDLLKAAKLRNEMEEEWSRISHDFQVDI